MCEERCPFIEFYCNGCEEQPCICAEHGEAVDVCRALYPDYPDESTKRESLTSDWSLEFCIEGGFKTCPDYQRRRGDDWRTLAVELGEALKGWECIYPGMCPECPYGGPKEKCAKWKVLAKLDAARKEEGK